MSSYFPTLPKITYEGPASDNPLAFRYYDARHQIGNKTMAEHLRFALAYWHSMGGNGADPFGAPTRPLPWLTAKDPASRAKKKADAAFEFMQKVGLEFYCWHDYDLIEEGATLTESNARLAALVPHLQNLQKDTGISLLWGTANLFSHPRYMNGAATNPEADIVAYAAAQVKTALDTNQALGGQNYVFWGGREGYLSLLNTNMKREREHLARFFHLARDYGRSIGFTGKFLIEPKPMEPTKHQYDYDAATVIGFLREFDLLEDFALNIEVNHATLSGHSFEHELQVASEAGVLGSIDANRGDYQNGWDTDQFPNNPLELLRAMRVILKNGGLQPGGINFDAKLRRNSTDIEDLCYAHIGGMDAFARALRAAHAMAEDGELDTFVLERYASFDSGFGQAFASGNLDFAQLAAHAKDNHPATSGRQEWCENLLSRWV